jgi:hypothetical protein
MFQDESNTLLFNEPAEVPIRPTAVSYGAGEL